MFKTNIKSFFIQYNRSKFWIEKYSAS